MFHTGAVALLPLVGLHDHTQNGESDEPRLIALQGVGVREGTFHRLARIELERRDSRRQISACR